MSDDELASKIISAVKRAYIKGFQDGRRFGKKKSRRKAFSPNTKKLVLLLQGLRCQSCRCILNVHEFDHIDGNKANNLSNNCQALCPNCHAKKTKKTKLRV